MTLSWKTDLQKELSKEFGASKEKKLFKNYQDAFSSSYMDEHSVKMAINDIGQLERLDAPNALAMHFYYSAKPDQYLHLRLYQWQKPIALSDILPMLENLNLRTENERPYKITLPNEEHWISDFTVTYYQDHFSID